ncbi:MAG: hypothetical protein ACKOKB_08325, partial [Bacteroidota bacterium]
MGPRSIVKTEKVHESIFKDAKQSSNNETVSLQPPKKVLDFEKWMTKLMRDCGYKEWDEAVEDLNLPGKTMLLFPSLQHTETPTDKKTMLRTAIILSKSNSHRYWPHSPMIFTQNRLNRSVRMIEVNTNDYYGMDEE